MNAMIIAIYVDGERQVEEAPRSKTPYEWRKTMKQVGKSFNEEKLIASVVVIDGIDVFEYEGGEVVDIFGARA